MALVWNVKENENAYREVSKEEYTDYLSNRNIVELPTHADDGKYYMMTRECFTLIWLCGITIGVPNLTNENFEKVYNRINIHEKLFGCSLHNYNSKTQIREDAPLTLEIVKRNIGISTNGIYMSVDVWKKHLLKRIVDDTKNY